MICSWLFMDAGPCTAGFHSILCYHKEYFQRSRSFLKNHFRHSGPVAEFGNPCFSNPGRHSPNHGRFFFHWYHVQMSPCQTQVHEFHQMANFWDWSHMHVRLFQLFHLTNSHKPVLQTVWVEPDMLAATWTMKGNCPYWWSRKNQGSVWPILTHLLWAISIIIIIVPPGLTKLVLDNSLLHCGSDVLVHSHFFENVHRLCAKDNPQLS